EILAAAEGLSLNLEPAGGSQDLPAEHRMPRFHARVSIALGGAGESFIGTAWKALAQDHYDVVAVNDLDGLNQDDRADYQPHLVLLEHQGGLGSRPLDPQFFSRQSRRHTPVIVVVSDGRVESAQDAFDAGASDVLLQPFAGSQLRSRVDSWLLRSGIAVDRRIRGMRTAARAALRS
ncbi:MAG: hypothetical protein ACYDAG_03375, partial [Chloroflexota bacterium]